MRKLTLLAVISCIFFILVTPCFATCFNLRAYPEEKFRDFIDHQTVIFFGEVVAIQPAGHQTERITARVIRSWKGVGSDQISFTYIEGTDGQWDFTKDVGGVGTQRIFYVGTTKEGELTTGYCNFTGNDDERMKAYLGEGQLIVQPSPSAEPTHSSAEQQGQSFFSWLWDRIVSIFKSA